MVTGADGPRIGVLALQGDFAEHLKILRACGATAFEVRSHRDLESADALVIPGGESTTMLKLIDRFDLRDLLKKRITDGMPVFGTCAGGIVLARKVSDGEPPLELLDAEIVRNAYGRQVDSFETVIDFEGIGTITGVFIRAPVIEAVGSSVEVLAEWAGRPVAIRSGAMLVSTFHPELTGEQRLHRYFIENVVGG